MTARPFTVLLMCAAITGCSWNFPYSIPIQQGNVITVEMLQELELGMDKRKVRYVLGTPLVTDAFHQDRWDYYYSYKHGLGDKVQQRASLYFEDDRLVRVDADMDSKIDFHTVTDVNENVVIVPRKKKGGFLAALTPAFVEREEAEAREEALDRSLDSGFNDPQPGSGVAAASGEPVEAVLDPALTAPAIIGPGLGDGVSPSELYAPNTSTDFEGAGAWSTEPATPVEAISPETQARSRYLQDLFEGFGAAAPDPEALAAPTPIPGTDTDSRFSPQPSRD